MRVEKKNCWRHQTLYFLRMTPPPLPKPLGALRVSSPASRELSNLGGKGGRQKRGVKRNEEQEVHDIESQPGPALCFQSRDVELRESRRQPRSLFFFFFLTALSAPRLHSMSFTYLFIDGVICYCNVGTNSMKCPDSLFTALCCALLLFRWLQHGRIARNKYLTLRDSSLVPNLSHEDTWARSSIHICLNRM